MARVLVGTDAGHDFRWVEDVPLARGWLGPVADNGIPMMSRLYLVKWTSDVEHRVVIHATGPMDAAIRLTGDLVGREKPTGGQVTVAPVVHAVFTDEERAQIKQWSGEEKQEKHD